MKKDIIKVKSAFNARGFALPLVLGVIVVLLILSLAAYEVSLNNQQISARTLSHDKALYQAESAYNKCLWELNSTGYTFYQALDPSPEDITFNNKDYRRYRLPEGSNYRQEVLVPLVTVPGMSDLQEDNNHLIIRSTAWETADPGHLRTIEVEVYKRTFTQHAMANNSEKLPDGTQIWWISGEEMYGPLHTNETLYVQGNPVFYGPVTYVNSINISPTANINNPHIFRKGNAKAASLSLPPSNPELKAHARINGHYYQGRSCINLLENGGYNIRSYDSKDDCWRYNKVKYEFIPKNKDDKYWTQAELENEQANNSSDKMFHRLDNDTYYPSFASMEAAIGSLSLPENGVIYVDGGTGDGNTGDRLYKKKMDRNLGNVFVSGKLKGRLTIAAANDIYITGHDPCDWSRPPASTSSWFPSNPGVSYSETGFTQEFVDGEWDHTAVTGTGDDMLGLVAGRKVHILHYKWPSGYDKPNYRVGTTTRQLTASPDYYWNISTDIELAPRDIYINAAIFAGQEYFGLENYGSGTAKGNIFLVGSITQQFRGPVGTFSGSSQLSGYNKKYSHDPRMLLDAPPLFPHPANIGWLSARWNESSEHIQ